MMVVVVWLVLGSFERGLGWVRAKLRALSQVHIGSSSLSAFIAADSCLMLMDDRPSTATRLRLICVRSGVGLSWCTGAF